MYLKGIVFYHPKNPRNVSDMAAIAGELGTPFIVVARPGEEYTGVRVVQSIEEAVEAITSKDDVVLVLETYGESVERVLTGCLQGAGGIAIILGAEDYGVPIVEVEKLKLKRRVCVAKLPVRALGHSYNVVSSLVMILYELKVSGILSR